MSVAAPRLREFDPRWELVEEVVRRDHDFLLRRAKRRFGWVERGRLEECLQAAYVDACAISRAGSLPEMRVFIARAFNNKLLDLVKSPAHTRTMLYAKVPRRAEPIAPGADALLEDELTRAMLKDVVGSLSERSRAVVRLRFEDGFSAKQVCALLCISEKQYAKSMHRALQAIARGMDSIGTGAYCDEVKRPVHRYAIHTASAEETATARGHLAWCGACATYVAALRAHLHAAGALVPVPVVISGHGPLAGWLLDGAHAAKQHAEALAGRATPADDAASSATQIAAAGGTRGAGGVLAAKLLTLCVGGAAAAGGAAYCVEQGIDPVSGLKRIVAPARKERPKPPNTARAAQQTMTPAAATPPQPPTSAPQQSAGTPPAQPATRPQPPPDPHAEYEPLSAGGGGANQSSAPSTPAPAPSGGSGEFNGP